MGTGAALSSLPYKPQQCRKRWGAPGFHHIASVSPGNSEQNQTWEEQREQLQIPFAEDGEMLEYSSEGTSREQGAGPGQRGGQEAGLRAAMLMPTDSERWRGQQRQNRKQRLTAAFQADVAEPFTLEKQEQDHVALLYISNP